MIFDYEICVRTEELIRNNNWSLKKLEAARLKWKLGNEIEWKNLIGKGGGGKQRDIIKLCLVERIFEQSKVIEKLPHQYIIKSFVVIN